MMSLCYSPPNTGSLEASHSYIYVWKQARECVSSVIFFSRLPHVTILRAKCKGKLGQSCFAFISHAWWDRAPPSRWSWGRWFHLALCSSHSCMMWQSKCHSIIFKEQEKSVSCYNLSSSPVMCSFYITIKHFLPKALSRGRWTFKSLWLFYI